LIVWFLYAVDIVTVGLSAYATWCILYRGMNMDDCGAYLEEILNDDSIVGRSEAGVITGYADST
jgi:hypothetical protein